MESMFLSINKQKSRATFTTVLSQNVIIDFAAKLLASEHLERIHSAQLENQDTLHPDAAFFSLALV